MCGHCICIIIQCRFIRWWLSMFGLYKYLWYYCRVFGISSHRHHLICREMQILVTSLSVYLLCRQSLWCWRWSTYSNKYSKGWLLKWFSNFIDIVSSLGSYLTLYWGRLWSIRLAHNRAYIEKLSYCFMYSHPHWHGVKINKACL